MRGPMVKLGVVQMSMSSEKDDNNSKAMGLVRAAAEKGADVVCLPELFSMRYFPSEKGNAPSPETVTGPTARLLSEAARDNGVVLVGGSIFEHRGRKRYNSCLTFSERGELLGVYRKVHVPQDEHYYEQDYFSPGDGYKVYRTTCGRVGTLICFDQWYPEAARVNRLMGAEVLFYPTAIGRVDGVAESEGDWQRAWESVQVGHAVSNSLVVCAVNRVGTEGPTAFWGGSFVCDQFGKVLFRAGSREGAFVVECDLGLGADVEGGWGFLRNRRSDTYGPLTK